MALLSIYVYMVHHKLDNDNNYTTFTFPLYQDSYIHIHVYIVFIGHIFTYIYIFSEDPTLCTSMINIQTVHLPSS